MLDYPNANIFTQSFPQWLCWSVHFADHPLSLSVLILYGQMSPPIVTPRYYVALRQMSGNYLIRANGDQRTHCHKEHFCSVSALSYLNCRRSSLKRSEMTKNGNDLRDLDFILVPLRSSECVDLVHAYL